MIMIKFEVLKGFAAIRKNDREIDIFFNYVKKYLQACLKEKESEAQKMLGKAISMLCKLNSLCMKETGHHFILGVLNPFDEHQMEEVIGEVLIQIIRNEGMLMKAENAMTKIV